MQRRGSGSIFRGAPDRVEENGMGYDPFKHWLDTLDESLDRIVEMEYDFKTGEIVSSKDPEILAPESFEKQEYHYRVRKDGQEQTRAIDAEGDGQALRRAIDQTYPGLQPPVDKRACLEVLVQIRIANEDTEEKLPLILWMKNVTKGTFVYDTESGRHYIKQSQNKPELS